MVARPLQRLVSQRHIGDQSARLADLVHHLVAGINAQPAGDAGQLLPVANINPHRADVRAGHAVDAIAQLLCPFGLAMLAARLAAPVAIANGDGVFVHHRRLNTRPWAGVNTDLLPRETAKGKGRQRQDDDGDVSRRARGQRKQRAQQRRRVGEVEHPSPTGRQRDQQPQRPFRKP
ncbi:hypothetical protein GALL_445090 [mine drainage metagenome]|uniref:Uncharacterized protein n=1 Tax=mine drainage metagenome TaxID=410659 RepID=A0A1J5Q1F5_9ZZZZ